MQKCAFLPRAQRAERNFSPVGPNVMSCRDKCLDFQGIYLYLVATNDSDLEIKDKDK